MAREEFRDLLGIETSPLWSMVTRWPMSMPQYQVGHLNQVADIQRQVTRHPGLAIVGNAYSGVGLPDCVHSGETAAEQILKLVPAHYSSEK